MTHPPVRLGFALRSDSPPAPFGPVRSDVEVTLKVKNGTGTLEIQALPQEVFGPLKPTPVPPSSKPLPQHPSKVEKGRWRRGRRGERGEEQHVLNTIPGTPGQGRLLIAP